ncbi:MAG: hypothetical protein UV67_C0005G0033 [Parcubacteria group bacterium GW2011_GWC1_43_12]|nr:MAG: hypothetical protein UV34_C0002G0013 [Parcubacteria group bacterium GW2011_GWB1_42_6]KKS92370.1 MAG: hypothetical protein UV67_C0005G0033 [Parcubacteria group bacterium GW2011_GWC1_43_12]
MPSRKIKVYLAGQANEYENNWKEKFKKIEEFDFHDWEFDSDQTSPDTYFPDDLNGIDKAEFMVANPGLAPSEGTWIEIGYFYGQHVKQPGDFCKNLIIIWKENRNPKWSIDFVNKTGFVVKTVDEAIVKLKGISNCKMK